MRNTEAPRGGLGIKLRLVIFMAVSHRHKTAPQAELSGLSKDGRQSLGGLWLPASHGQNDPSVTPSDTPPGTEANKGDLGSKIPSCHFH